MSEQRANTGFQSSNQVLWFSLPSIETMERGNRRLNGSVMAGCAGAMVDDLCRTLLLDLVKSGQAVVYILDSDK
jgi:hypothetical protein